MGGTVSARTEIKHALERVWRADGMDPHIWIYRRDEEVPGREERLGHKERLGSLEKVTKMLSELVSSPSS